MMLVVLLLVLQWDISNPAKFETLSHNVNKTVCKSIFYLITLL